MIKNSFNLFGALIAISKGAGLKPKELMPNPGGED
jgi:hypothetical protein